MLSSSLCEVGYSSCIRSRLNHATGEGWKRVALELRLTRGLCFAARADPVAAALVGLLDGKRSLAEAVDLFADRHGVPPGMFLEDLPWAIRPLLDLGLLIPAGEETAGRAERLDLLP